MSPGKNAYCPNKRGTLLWPLSHNHGSLLSFGEGLGPLRSKSTWNPEKTTRLEDNLPSAPAPCVGWSAEGLQSFEELGVAANFQLLKALEGGVQELLARFPQRQTGRRAPFQCGNTACHPLHVGGWGGGRGGGGSPKYGLIKGLIRAYLGSLPSPSPP